jgi:LacI family transcriptional regulator
MPNQRDIARAMAVSQVAVSLALRGDRSVSADLRKRVRLTAKRLGYRPNPYVNTLMSHIRAGRKPSEKGVIALLVDIFREEDWHQHESYRVYYRGVVRRSAELGFHLQRFFLLEPGMTAAKIDRILYARGIHGVILAPPYLGNRRLTMNWSRYACVGTGYGWERQQFDRVAHDHDQNVVLAFQKLSELGYARIGMSIPSFFAQGRGARWVDGFLICQHRLPKERRIPLFVGSTEENSFAKFGRWHAKWRPDALLTLYGHESKWLETLGLRFPRDIGLACVIRPEATSYAGIDDHYDEIGAATVELVASKIAFNQYGIPPKPKLILIEGHWVDGKSLRRKGKEAPLQF